MRILICDDDPDIREAIAIYLRHEGYETVPAADGFAVLEALRSAEPFHLIIMDVMMPGMDGLRATMRLREHSNIPVLMLSAKTEDSDKVLGLQMGADDYLAKPFNPLELTARVKSLLRRYTELGGYTTKPTTYRSGGLVVDDECKTVSVDGEPVHLTPVEYNILLFLVKSPGRVYTIDQIYEAAWQQPAYNAENTVAVHIRRIREKIEINPKEPKYVKVVWGIGYKLEKH